MNFLEQVVMYDIKYVFCAGILVLVYISMDKKYTKKIRFIDIIAIFVLIFFSAYRYNVGSDFQEYFARYKYINEFWYSVSPRITHEKLFYYLCHLTSKFTDHPFAIFHMCAWMLYPPFVVFARKLTGKPSRIVGCFVFLEFYAVSNNILRQAIAMELVVFGYYAWKYKKRKLSIILFAFSMGFHLTAIIGIGLVFVSQVIKPSYDSLRVAFICGIASLFVWKILLHFVNVIPYISRYSSYLEHTGEDITRLGMWGYILFYTWICCLMIKNYRQIQNIDSPTASTISMIILAIPLLFIATQITYVNRIALYLYQFSMFSIPILFDMRVLKKQTSRLILVLVLVLWLGFSNIVAMDNSFFQYSFQWNI